MSEEFLQLSLVPMLIGGLAALTAALLGNFLLLRRQSLIGDAISHVALPGIVGAFLLTGSLSTGPMLAGAAIMAVGSVLLIELVRRLGRIEPGAAMGVIFTAFFALGVLMLEQGNLASVHLDVEHVLYGNLESLIWLTAPLEGGWPSADDLHYLPPQLPRLLLVFVVAAGFVILFWKELTIGTFDPGFARTIGAWPRLTDFLLVIMVAVASVAAFDAVGSIIVIAMFICPPATARLLSRRLLSQTLISMLFALLAATGGYVLAGYGPGWLGADFSVSAAGMIATLSGIMLGVVAILKRQQTGGRAVTGPAEQTDEA